MAGGVWVDPGAVESARALLSARYDLDLGLWDLVNNTTLREALLAETALVEPPNVVADLTATQAIAKIETDRRAQERDTYERDRQDAFGAYGTAASGSAWSSYFGGGGGWYVGPAEIDGERPRAWLQLHKSRSIVEWTPPEDFIALVRAQPDFPQPDPTTNRIVVWVGPGWETRPDWGDLLADAAEALLRCIEDALQLHAQGGRTGGPANDSRSPLKGEVQE